MSALYPYKGILAYKRPMYGFVSSLPIPGKLRLKSLATFGSGPGQWTAQTSRSIVSARSVHGGGDLVPQVPKLPIGDVLHALLQNFYWCSTGSDHPAPDDALCQFEVMKAE